MGKGSRRRCWWVVEDLLRDSRRCRGGITTMQVFRLRKRRRHLLRYTLFLAVRLILGVPRWNHPYRSHHSGHQQQDDGRCQYGRYRQQPPMSNCSVRAARWHAEAVAGEGFAQRWPGGPQLIRGGVDAAQLLGQRVGPARLWPGREEAAGLPAQPVVVVPAPRLGSALGNERVPSEPTSSSPPPPRRCGCGRQPEPGQRSQHGAWAR